MLQPLPKDRLPGDAAILWRRSSSEVGPHITCIRESQHDWRAGRDSVDILSPFCEESEGIVFVDFRYILARDEQFNVQSNHLLLDEFSVSKRLENSVN